MSLIRGSMSKQPCPVCTVGVDELVDITKTWSPRTAACTQELVTWVHTLNIIEHENLLSKGGLCNINAR